jgi:hypothetical protein
MIEKHEIELKLLDWFKDMAYGVTRRTEAATVVLSIRELLSALNPVSVAITPWHTYDNFSIRISIQFQKNSGVYVDDLTFPFSK